LPGSYIEIVTVRSVPSNTLRDAQNLTGKQFPVK